MRRVERRQTIHLNCCNRGKLRKVEHHRLQPKQEGTALLLTPNHLVVNLSTSREARQRPLLCLRKQELRSRNQEHSAQKAGRTGSEDDSETFRAIHTASPYLSLRKVRLRSVTPLKDHHHHHHPSQKFHKYSPEAEAGVQREEVLSMKLREMKNAQLSRTAEIVAAAQQIIPRYAQYAEYAGSQEFYQYRIKRSPLPVARQEEQERRRIAGKRIEPFKKYQIREVHRSGYSQRNYEYPLMINQ